MDDLKNYDDKLIYVIIFNVAVTLLFNNPATFVENNEIISILLTVPVLYLPIYVINNLFSREWKYKILYPKNESHRFAYGIFSKLKDFEIEYDYNLIDVDLILKIHGNPETKTKEDQLWYEIYNKHRYDNKIYQQNRQFLFCRDTMATVLILTPVFSGLAIVFGFSSLILIFIVIGIGEFIIFRKLAQKQNMIFVLSVLQEETNYLRKEFNHIKILNISNYNLINN